MKKLFSFILGLAIVFSGLGLKADAASPTDWWADEDAKVTPYVYSLLLERAGFASYIYTGEKISMNPSNLANFTIEEKYSNFFIGSFRDHSTKVLVSSDGLVVAYVPKEDAHAIIMNDRHFLDLQSAVKIFIGPTISKANYINFASLDSNKAFFFYYNGDVNWTIPSQSKIDVIAFADISSYEVWSSSTIVPGSLQPGVTHLVDVFDRTIDEVKVNSNYANSMSVFYSSNEKIETDKTNDYTRWYKLSNMFVPVMTDTPFSHWAYEDISWAIKRGMLRGFENGSFKPDNSLTESQFISILSKYYNLNTSLDGDNEGSYDEDGAYIYLKQYNLPLKGYTDKKVRNKPITRGTVAQILSMTQGGPSDVNGAVKFLQDHSLTTAQSVTAYKPTGILTRSQISAFFKRMNTAELTEIN